MNMRLEKRSIQLERLCGICSDQITVAGDVQLPGSLRETANILHARAMAVVESAEAQQDRIMISGRVIFSVLYQKTGSEKTESLEATADFNHTCMAAGAIPRAEVYACVQAGPAEANALNSRIALKTMVQLHARVCSCEAAEIITGIEGAQQQTTQRTMQHTVSRGSAETLLREEFALPADLAITDTLGATAHAMLQEATGGQARIGLTGEVLMEVVHTSSVPGKPLVVTRHTVPFNQSVEVRGETGESLDGRIVVKDVAVASQDMGDGERTLRAEVLLGLSAWAEKEESIQVLSDAYTTSGEDVRLTQESITLRTGANRIHAAESGKVSLLLEGAPPIRTMLTAFAQPEMTSHMQQGSRHIVEGMLHAVLVYISDGAEPVSATVDTPFRAAFAAEAGADDLLTLTAAEVEAMPVTSDRAEMRYVLHLDVDGLRTAAIPLVTEATAVPGAPTTGDIVLYFPQPGESAWDIAKRYRIPESTLRSLNPDMGENPKLGQGLVVWRRNAT